MMLEADWIISAYLAATLIYSIFNNYIDFD